MRSGSGSCHATLGWWALDRPFATQLNAQLVERGTWLVDQPAPQADLSVVQDERLHNTADNPAQRRSRITARAGPQIRKEQAAACLPRSKGARWLRKPDVKSGAAALWLRSRCVLDAPIGSRADSSIARGACA